MRFFGFANLIFLLLLNHCVKKDLSPSLKEKKILRIAVEEDCTNLDPRTSYTPRCLEQFSLYMEGLVRAEYAEGKLKTIPALAEKWEALSPVKYQITLRNDVHWSNGANLTSNDFLRSWKHLLSNSKNAFNVSLLFPFKNAKAFFEKRLPFSEVGLKATDPFTLELTLETPIADPLSLFSHPALFPSFSSGPPHATASIGPFLVTQRVPGKSITLKENPFYWNKGSHHLKEIQISIIPDSKKRLALFEDAQTDLIELDSRATPLPTLGFTKILFPKNQAYYLYFNERRPPLLTNAERKYLQENTDIGELRRLISTETLSNFHFLFSPPTESQPSWFPVFSKSDEPKEISETLKIAVPRALGENGMEVAENLRAQWAKNLRIASSIISTDVATPKGEPYWNVLLFETRLSPFTHMNASTFNDFTERTPHTFSQNMADTEELEKFYITEASILLPLFRKNRILLIRNSFTGLKQSALELMDFSEVK